MSKFNKSALYESIRQKEQELDEYYLKYNSYQFKATELKEKLRNETDEEKIRELKREIEDANCLAFKYQQLAKFAHDELEEKRHQLREKMNIFS